MSEGLSIHQRIAALNIGQVGLSPHQKPTPPPASQKPAPPPLPTRSRSAQAGTVGSDVGNEPARPPPGPAPVKRVPPPPPRGPPPPRNAGNDVRSSPTNGSSKSGPPPVLPPRNPSQALVRTVSQDSTSSSLSTTSTPRTSLTIGSDYADLRSVPPALPGRAVKAPAYDPSALPDLPAKRVDQPKVPSRPSLTSRQPSTSSYTPKTPVRPATRPVSTIANRTNPSKDINQQDVRPTIKAPMPEKWGVQYQPPPKKQPDPVPEPEPVVPQQQVTTTHGRTNGVTPTSISRPTSVIPQQDATNGNAVLPKRSALSWGMNKKTEAAPGVPTTRPGITTSNSEPSAIPPPVPLGSRPDLAALQASKPKPGAVGSTQPIPPSSAPVYQPPVKAACLKCRDFKAVDAHAARFPRESIPTQDVAWLSQQLTAPFPSHTDKARALFTWQHHNVAYDTVAFFGKNVQGTTPEKVIATGLAVCDGYSKLFNAMALYAGLESIIVTGHGAGYGFSKLGPNDPYPPRDPSGHAWNAVKIDNGEWKLIDVCWGAGAINDQQMYHKNFNPTQFTRDNNEFGRKHFPSDPSHFFRLDGRVPTWEEYMDGPDGRGESAQIWSGCVEKWQFSEYSFYPRKKDLDLRLMDPRASVRFQMQPVCEHWNPLRNGPGPQYTYYLAIGGQDGRNEQKIPYRTNGKLWWVDVKVSELGCVGQKINCYALTDLNGKSARGVTHADFEARKCGGSGWQYGGVALWQLV